MASIQDDPRIDPRLKALLGAFPSMTQPDVASRDQAIAEANTPEAVSMREAMGPMLEMFDSELVAPSTGLTVTTHEITSAPDGNTIRVRLIRPDSEYVGEKNRRWVAAEERQ